MSIIYLVKMNSLDIIRKYKYSCIVLLGFMGYTDPEKIFNSFELNAKQNKVNTYFFIFFYFYFFFFFFFLFIYFFFFFLP